MYHFKKFAPHLFEYNFPTVRINSNLSYTRIPLILRLLIANGYNLSRESLSLLRVARNSSHGYSKPLNISIFSSVEEYAFNPNVETYRSVTATEL